MTDPQQLMFDVPDVVHGIKSLTPPTIQCDGCGDTVTGPKLGLLIVTCGIEFRPVRYHQGDTRRMCRTCWAKVKD